LHFNWAKHCSVESGLDWTVQATGIASLLWFKGILTGLYKLGLRFV
jgi:hypothetical protein